MRILFYLPVVTPWWFSNIVIHLIQTAARSHEVHVMIPPLWQGTGISKAEAHHIEALPHVHWHLLNGADHPVLRRDASAQDDLIEFVKAIAPDITLCRSADVKTPAMFPGEVRFIMESAAPPFALEVAHCTFKTGLFDHGFMPQFTPEISAQLGAIADELWPDMLAPLNLPARSEFFSQARVTPKDGHRLIALPLEYEHPENFFGQHHAFPSNAAMITHVAQEIGDTATLIVSHHPLTELHGDTSAANAAILEQGGRVKLLRRSNGRAPGGADVTIAMIKHCDVAVIGNSKSWSIAAAFGTPMARLSSAPTADWLAAYDAIAPLMRDLEAGCAKSADLAVTKRWFAHHILNLVMNPADGDARAQDIVERVFQPVDPARWERALTHYRALHPAPPAHKQHKPTEKSYA